MSTIYGSYPSALPTPTDELILVNYSKDIKRYARSGELCINPSFLAAKTIILPYHYSIIKQLFMTPPHILSAFKRIRERHKIDCTKLLTKIALRNEKELLTFDEMLYSTAMEALGLPPKCGSPVPSTGFLALCYALAQPETQHFPLHIFGFTWQGWAGHPWAAERQHILTVADRGRIVIHPVQDNMQA
ncbi:MAG: hypothetical protein OXC62_10175 [Aestuariivita sp.]|nr:hypothetical protein [Aestuariivita sp.]